MASSAQYTNVNDQVFNNLKTRLGEMGIKIEGTSGRISEKGVAADYSYDPESLTLAISNLSVSFPASLMFNESKILQKISEVVEGSGGRLAV